MKEIILTRGQVALVDDEDYEWLNQWKWTSSFTPSTKSYYARRLQYLKHCKKNEKRKAIKMHRVIMERIVKRELKSKEMIDHINNNTLDNRRYNLRIVSNRQNAQNRKGKTTSKYPGVYWRKERSRWLAKIYLNGKTKYLGQFTNEREAAKAYEKACRELVGEELVCKLS